MLFIFEPKDIFFFIKSTVFILCYDVIGSLEKTNEPRPCAGTTATVYKLFHKAPVRLKHMHESHTMNEVLALVQAQALCLAGKVSISLRDEQKGKVLLNTSRIKSVKGAKNSN